MAAICSMKISSFTRTLPSDHKRLDLGVDKMEGGCGDVWGSQWSIPIENDNYSISYRDTQCMLNPFLQIQRFSVERFPRP